MNIQENNRNFHNVPQQQILSTNQVMNQLYGSNNMCLERAQKVLFKNIQKILAGLRHSKVIDENLIIKNQKNLFLVKYF